MVVCGVGCAWRLFWGVSTRTKHARFLPTRRLLASLASPRPHLIVPRSDQHSSNAMLPESTRLKDVPSSPCGQCLLTYSLNPHPFPNTLPQAGSFCALAPHACCCLASPRIRCFIRPLCRPRVSSPPPASLPSSSSSSASASSKAPAGRGEERTDLISSLAQQARPHPPPLSSAPPPSVPKVSRPRP